MEEGYKSPYLSHRHPLDTFVLVDVLDDTLMHEQNVWPTGDIRVNGHREYELVCGRNCQQVILCSDRSQLTIFPIEVVEMVLPDILDVPVRY